MEAVELIRPSVRSGEKERIAAYIEWRYVSIANAMPPSGRGSSGGFNLIVKMGSERKLADQILRPLAASSSVATSALEEIKRQFTQIEFELNQVIGTWLGVGAMFNRVINAECAIVNSVITMEVEIPGAMMQYVNPIRKIHALMCSETLFAVQSLCGAGSGIESYRRDLIHHLQGDWLERYVGSINTNGEERSKAYERLIKMIME